MSIDATGMNATAVLDEAAAAAAMQDDVKRVMTAFTRMLVGEKGDPRGAALNDNVMIIVGASLPANSLLWLADVARDNSRHVLHISEQADCDIPTVVLAYRRGEMVEVYEYCMLCPKPGDDRVTIVPDSFANGGFRFGSDMKLKRRKSPASFEGIDGAGLQPLSPAARDQPVGQLGTGQDLHRVAPKPMPGSGPGIVVGSITTLGLLRASQNPGTMSA